MVLGIKYNHSITIEMVESIIFIVFSNITWKARYYLIHTFLVLRIPVWSSLTNRYSSRVPTAQDRDVLSSRQGPTRGNHGGMHAARIVQAMAYCSLRFDEPGRVGRPSRAERSRRSPRPGLYRLRSRQWG